ncbi:MAG: hypothetical protein HY550_04345 [Elusimicrobia bacterium]|nr:hypothetical protein [Elusimicrobiota bacterium]
MGRKTLAALLVLAQLLVMPGLGAYQAAASTVGKGYSRSSGMRVNLSGLRGLSGMVGRLMGRRAAPAIDATTTKIKSISGASAAEAVNAAEAIAFGGVGEGAVTPDSEPMAPAQAAMEAEVYRGHSLFDRLRRMPRAEQDALVAAGYATRVQGQIIPVLAGASDRSEPAPRAPSKLEQLRTHLETYEHAASAAVFTAVSMKWSLLASFLGASAFYVAQVPLNAGELLSWLGSPLVSYGLAALGHASYGIGVASQFGSDLLGRVSSVAGVAEIKSLPGGLAYVFGSLAHYPGQFLGWSAGLLGSASEALAAGSQRVWESVSALPTFGVKGQWLLDKVPAQYQGMGIAAAAAFHGHIRGYWKQSLTHKAVANPWLKNLIVPVVAASLFDVLAVMPALLVRDMTRGVWWGLKNIGTVIKETWNFLREYAFPYVKYVTWHPLRALLNGIAVGSVAAVVSPFYVVAASVLNWLGTPSLRAIKGVTIKQAAVGVAVVGMMAMGGWMLVTGWATVVALAGPAAPLFSAAVWAGWKIVATVFGLYGTAAGLYYGYVDGWRKTADQQGGAFHKAAKKVVGSLGQLVEEAKKTFRRTEQE